jgi:hypothetical protein
MNIVSWNSCLHHRRQYFAESSVYETLNYLKNSLSLVSNNFGVQRKDDTAMIMRRNDECHKTVLNK